MKTLAVTPELHKIIEQAEYAFPEGEITMSVVRDLDFWLSSCQDKTKRLTPAKFEQFLTKREDYCCSRSPDDPKCYHWDLPFLASYWGASWIEHMQVVQSENIGSESSACSPAELLEDLYESALDAWRLGGSSRTVTQFLKSEDSLRMNTNLPAFMAFVVMHVCEVDDDSIISQWQSTFVDELYANTQIWSTLKEVNPDLLDRWTHGTGINDHEIKRAAKKDHLQHRCKLEAKDMYQRGGEFNQPTRAKSTN